MRKQKHRNTEARTSHQEEAKLESDPRQKLCWAQLLTNTWYCPLKHARSRGTSVPQNDASLTGPCITTDLFSPTTKILIQKLRGGENMWASYVEYATDNNSEAGGSPKAPGICIKEPTALYGIEAGTTKGLTYNHSKERKESFIQ